jgi:hypothetical protein
VAVDISLLTLGKAPGVLVGCLAKLFSTEVAEPKRALVLLLTHPFGAAGAAALPQQILLAVFLHTVATAAQAAQQAPQELSPQAAAVAQLPVTLGLAAQARSS